MMVNIELDMPRLSNGINWKRDDKLMGLNIGGAYFDEYSVCYPNIFIHENYIYMLYSEVLMVKKVLE